MRRMENQPGRSQAQYDQCSATEAAQHFMSLLTRAIPEDRRQGQSTSVEKPTVAFEMARSFPGFFKRNGKNRSHPFRRPANVVKTSKPLEVPFFLLGSKTDTTPSISAELELMQAGLGKRALSITSDLTHAELSSSLRTIYPKMNDLQDRWLLFKAAGGNGRRKLSAIALEAEGYTGSVIKRASGGGKQLLYIVPLQDELDLTPLPADAPEFARMPTETCKQCKTVMPLQMLALHIDHCNSTSNSETEAGEVQCPICTRTFPVSDIELHASFCSERVAGEIFGVSIAQGGPAPRFMQEWCYHYLVTGNLKTDGVHDTELSPLIKTIEDASDLSLYIEEILDCGYTGQINIDHKESILRAIVLHVTTKRTPMLQQMREGLEVYNLIKVMQIKPNECRNLFVVGDDDKVDSHYVLSHLAPEMSPHGSTKHVKESKILEYFQDFLIEIEDTQPENEVEGETPSVPMVMQWMTGQAHRHLLVSERQKFKIAIVFDHNCLEHMPGHTMLSYC
ncbi:unnamed protein product [Arctogadus glacialis]